MIRFFIFVEFHLGTLMFAPSRNVLKSKFGRLHRKKKELQNIGQHLPLSSTSMKVKRPCLVKEPFNERNFKRKRVHFFSSSFFLLPFECQSWPGRARVLAEPRNLFCVATLLFSINRCRYLMSNFLMRLRWRFNQKVGNYRRPARSDRSLNGIYWEWKRCRRGRYWPTF